MYVCKIYDIRLEVQIYDGGRAIVVMTFGACHCHVTVSGYKRSARPALASLHGLCSLATACAYTTSARNPCIKISFIFQWTRSRQDDYQTEICWSAGGLVQDQEGKVAYRALWAVPKI